MASSSANRNSTKKKQPAKKNQGRKKTNSKKNLPLYKRISAAEARSTSEFIIGLILLVFVLFSASPGTLWNKLHTFWFAVFGFSACVIPFSVLLCGIVDVLGKPCKKIRIRLLELHTALLLVNAVQHIFNAIPTINAENYSEGIKSVYKSVMEYNLSGISGGGVIGAVTGGALYRLGNSSALAMVIIILLFIALFMVSFGISLYKVFVKMEKPAKKVGEYAENTLENAKTGIEKKHTEITAQREYKRQQRASNPVNVVDDFYRQNDIDSSAVATNKTSAVNEQNKQKINDSDNGNSQSQFSIFDMPGIKKVENSTVKRTPEIKPFKPVETQNAAPRVFDFSKPVDPVNVSVPVDDDFEEIIPSENGNSNKDEKLPSLTKEETDAINEELSSGLNSVPEKEYELPPMSILNRKPEGDGMSVNNDELQSNGNKLIEALNSFNVEAEIVDIVPGPTVTRYELKPAPGVKISKFLGLSDDLALHLAAPAGLRIEAPIPNKAAIGIEIPNKNKTSVYFSETIDSDDFRKAKSKLTVALGKDISGNVIYCDLAKMPHLLVAGTTGSGKSVCMNTMIMSLLYNTKPDEVKIILIDPKQVEFGGYNGIPQLLVPVVSDPRKASGALAWAVTEMLSRYKKFNENGVRDIKGYNSLCEGTGYEKMPRIVIFIDELADLMTVAPAEVEDSIQRLAQMARAAGMHLVIATQRPSVDVVTGIIKANIPSRIALTVKSQIDSRTMIDQSGAEKLMGNGDMLYYPVGIPKPIRVQGAYISDSEIASVVSFIKGNGEAEYDDSIQQEIEKNAAPEKKKPDASAENSAQSSAGDDLVLKALELFVNNPEKASISALQRHLSLGFAKAGRLMDSLEDLGYVGPTEGSKPRKVLITKTQFYEMCASNPEVSSNAINSDVAAVESFGNVNDFEDISTEYDEN